MSHAASASETEMTRTDKPAISHNAASGISYFTFIPAFVFLLVAPYKESPCVRFHAWQSILLCMTAFALDIVVGGLALLTASLSTGAVAYAMRLLFLFWFVLWAACVITALKGKRLKLPLIGGLAEKLSMK